ncbi:hypothetical protein HC931_03960 [Candidatus Gracilibacteria bacterium]|nr:hypothetical protein [Candidatus Gracilibacteria bacterium]NJM87180.1 hypothetical protein [Hydrococcus sp. RU_2_2]NJP20312.1 hypothetical protein [Hydrococcus sp. CRU_1_1]
MGQDSWVGCVPILGEKILVRFLPAKDVERGLSVITGSIPVLPPVCFARKGRRKDELQILYE